MIQPWHIGRVVINDLLFVSVEQIDDFGVGSHAGGRQAFPPGIHQQDR